MRSIFHGKIPDHIRAIANHRGDKRADTMMTLKSGKITPKKRIPTVYFNRLLEGRFSLVNTT
jgi:hypothetical protein